MLFNQSIATGKFPQCLKHAITTPIYEKGPKDDIENYRPISVLSTTSKFFESLMKKDHLCITLRHNLSSASTVWF